MHIDMSQSVIHYNHYQSKDSVNCEHTLGDKKNALFTVQRFPRGILVDWLVLLLDHKGWLAIAKLKPLVEREFLSTNEKA